MKISRELTAILIAIDILLPFAVYKFFYQSQPPKKPRVEEPIMDSAVRNFKIPAEYTILYDDTAHCYAATFTFNDLPDDPYFLAYEWGDSSYVSVKYNTTCPITSPNREGIIKIIMRHWAQILRDRASHKIHEEPVCAPHKFEKI